MPGVGLLSTAWRAFGVQPPPEAASVRCTRIPDFGFGVVATTSLRRGDELFRVPLGSALTVERSPHDDVDLALALLSAVETDEAWHGYASAVLPRIDELTASFLWPRSLIYELQDEVAIREAERCATRIGVLQRTIARRGRRAVGYGSDAAPRDSGPPSARALPFPGLLASQAGTSIVGATEDPLPLYRVGKSSSMESPPPEWALAVVLSRSILLHDARGGQLRALVPMADLFNHLPESPAEYIAAADASGEEDPPPCWELEEVPIIDGERAGDGSKRGGGAAGAGTAPAVGAWVVARAPHDVCEGHQVVLPYGLETDAELLATHGFLPAPNSAQYWPLFSSPEAMASAAAAYAAEMGSAAWPAGLDGEGCEHSAQGEIEEEDSGSEGPHPKDNGRPCPPRLAGLEERLEILLSIDASEAPLAVRPGNDLQVCTHVLGAAMLLAARPAELRLFGEVWGEAAGHAVIAAVVGRSAGGGGAMTAARAGELEAYACAFLSHAASAQLQKLTAKSGVDADAAARAALEAQVQLVGERETGGAPGGDGESILGARRMLLALRYREGVKRMLGSFVQRCEARRAELRAAGQLATVRRGAPRPSL